MYKRFAMLAVTLGLAGCTDAGHAVDLLTRQGYTNVQTHGYDWFACSEDDVFQTRFSATAPTGARVNGTVCKGWFKSSTIRFD